MGRILSKEEFMESMITSAEEAEESKNTDPKVPKEKPRKKPGPKPGSRKKIAENGEEIIKTAKENEPGDKDKETEPVAAGRKKRRSKKDAVMEEAVSEAIAKSNKQTEALRAAIQIMIDYTDGLTLKADKLANLADIYAGYIETLEEMTE